MLTVCALVVTIVSTFVLARLVSLGSSDFFHVLEAPNTSILANKSAHASFSGDGRDRGSVFNSGQTPMTVICLFVSLIVFHALAENHNHHQALIFASGLLGATAELCFPSLGLAAGSAATPAFFSQKKVIVILYRNVAKRKKNRVTWGDFWSPSRAQFAVLLRLLLPLFF